MADFPHFGPLVVAYLGAGMIAREVRSIGRCRDLTPGECRQLVALERLSDALRQAARRRESPTGCWHDAFTPLCGLIADAHSTMPDGARVPEEARAHPFPIRGESLAELGLSVVSACLVATITTPAAGRSRARLAQLEAANELGEALRAPEDAAHLDAAWRAAGDLIANELPAIVAEAATIATAAATGTPH